MKILIKQNIEDIIFIDIETAPVDPEFDEKSSLYDAWEYYCENKNFDGAIEIFNRSKCASDSIILVYFFYHCWCLR